jgi:hypothetical protein
MRRSLRTLAAVLAGLALVAALPACGCAPEGSASKQADDHSCCAPPAGVRAVDHGCCAETPATAQAVPSPVAPDALAPVAMARLIAPTPSAQRVLPRPAVTPADSPPLTVLRV